MPVGFRGPIEPFRSLSKKHAGPVRSCLVSLRLRGGISAGLASFNSPLSIRSDIAVNSARRNRKVEGPFEAMLCGGKTLLAHSTNRNAEATDNAKISSIARIYKVCALKSPLELIHLQLVNTSLSHRSPLAFGEIIDHAFISRAGFVGRLPHIAIKIALRKADQCGAIDRIGCRLPIELGRQLRLMLLTQLLPNFIAAGQREFVFQRRGFGRQCIGNSTQTGNINVVPVSSRPGTLWMRGIDRNLLINWHFTPRRSRGLEGVN